MEALLTTIVFGLFTFAILSIINAVLAYFVHLYEGDFDWNKLIDFMKKRIAVCVGVWFLFSVMNLLIIWVTNNFGYVMPDIGLGGMTIIINAFSALIVTLLGVKIADKIAKLSGKNGIIKE